MDHYSKLITALGLILLALGMFELLFEVHRRRGASLFMNLMAITWCVMMAGALIRVFTPLVFPQFEQILLVSFVSLFSLASSITLAGAAIVRIARMGLPKIPIPIALVMLGIVKVSLDGAFNAHNISTLQAISLCAGMFSILLIAYAMVMASRDVRVVALCCVAGGAWIVSQCTWHFEPGVIRELGRVAMILGCYGIAIAAISVPSAPRRTRRRHA